MEWGMIVLWVLGLVLLGFAAAKWVLPIIPLVKSWLGADTTIEKAELPEIPEERFVAELTSTWKYCGIGQSVEYCKCPIPMGSYGGKKIYLKGQGEGRTAFVWLAMDEEPELTSKGAIKNYPAAFSTEFARFGPLCVHFGPGSAIVGDPLSAFLPPGPERLDYLGVVFYKNDKGALAWSTNAWGDTDYMTWNAEPAVLWRKVDNTRCFWGPRVVGLKKKIANPVPDCPEIGINFAAAEKEFERFVQKAQSCKKGQQNTRLEYCTQFILTLPQELVIQADQTRLSLVFQETGQELAAVSFPKPTFCTVPDINNPNAWQYGSQQLASGTYYLSVAANAICITTQPLLIPPLPMSGEFPYFDSSISDGVYLNTFLNAPATDSRQNEERFDDVILREAKAKNVDFFLVKALIQQESSWDPAAKSSAGSIGLMQLTQETAETLRNTGKDCPADYASNAESNIKCGIANLAYLIQYTKEQNVFELKHILAGYNGGENALLPSEDCPEGLAWECEWDDPPDTPNRRRNEGPDSYAQTREYVVKVQNYYQQLVLGVA